MKSALLFFAFVGYILAAPSPTKENESNIDHQSEFMISSPINILTDAMRQFEDVFRIVFDKLGNYSDINVTTWEVLQMNGTPYFLNTTITDSNNGKSSPQVTVHLSTIPYSRRHKNENKNGMESDKKKKDSKNKSSKTDEKDDSSKSENEDKMKKADEKTENEDKKKKNDDKSENEDKKKKNDDKSENEDKKKKSDEKTENEDKNNKQKSDEKSSKKSKDKKQKKSNDDSDDDSDEED